MPDGSQWKELTAQQLVRYDALFALIDDIETSEDIAFISRRVASQWKYFANVNAWRLVVSKDGGYRIVDGFRGEARIDDMRTPDPWDAHHLELRRPRLVRRDDPAKEPRPPEHLRGAAVVEIAVLPFFREDRFLGLLSASARHEPFNDLDHKFIRIFGNHFANRISDILFRKQATEALLRKATRDALTGLLNRGAIIERLDEQLAAARRAVQPLGVILADIDFFKIVNDIHGHLAGDEVLREVARRLRETGRDGESKGRYGGEEFLLVLYPCDSSCVAKAAERFRRAIAERAFLVGGDPPKRIDVTISLGTATADGRKAIPWEALLMRADNALYRSKVDGRNRVTMSPPPE